MTDQTQNEDEEQLYIRAGELADRMNETSGLQGWDINPKDNDKAYMHFRPPTTALENMTLFHGSYDFTHEAYQIQQALELHAPELMQNIKFEFGVKFHGGHGSEPVPHFYFEADDLDQVEKLVDCLMGDLAPVLRRAMHDIAMKSDPQSLLGRVAYTYPLYHFLNVGMGERPINTLSDEFKEAQKRFNYDDSKRAKALYVLGASEHFNTLAEVVNHPELSHTARSMLYDVLPALDPNKQPSDEEYYAALYGFDAAVPAEWDEPEQALGLYPP